MVDTIARKNAENAVREGLEQMAVLFGCTPEWLKAAAPHFREGLVGRKEVSKFTAAQIEEAFAETIRSHKYGTPPKIADVLRIARESAPLPAMQKPHTDPTPSKTWTAEERRTNLAFMDALWALRDRQNEDPEYVEALRVHGRGSPELSRVVDRQRGEMQAWIKQNAPSSVPV